MFLDFNLCPRTLDSNESRNCWEHIHVVHSSQNHDVLSIRSLSLEQGSWLDQNWWGHSCNSWHLQKHELGGKWGGVEEGDPRLIFKRWLQNNHRSLINEIVRSVSCAWDVSSLHMTIRSLDFVLHSNLPGVEIKFLSWTEIACMLIYVIVYSIDSQIDTSGVDEIDSKRNFVRWHLSGVLSNLAVSWGSFSLWWSWSLGSWLFLLFFLSWNWFDSVLLGWWSATHFMC